MTGGPGSDEGPRWLLRPPEAGEVRLHIALGEGRELTPEARVALDQLIAALYQQDVASFVAACTPQCDDLRSCPRVSCTPLGNCGSLSVAPCLIDLSCKIKFA